MKRISQTDTSVDVTNLYANMWYDFYIKPIFQGRRRRAIGANNPETNVRIKTLEKGIWWSSLDLGS